MRADAYFGSCFTKKASAVVGYRERGSINQSYPYFNLDFSVSERKILNEMKIEIVQLKYMPYRNQLHKSIVTKLFF